MRTWGAQILQVLQVCKVCIPVQYMGNPEYLSQILVFPKNKKKMADELKTATALVALEHPGQKPVLWQTQVSPATLTSAATKERMMCAWESNIASVEFQQVKGSRMNGGGWEKAFYKAKSKKVQWSN